MQGSGFRGQKSDVRKQRTGVGLKRTAEYRMLNIEKKENFDIRNSLIDIRYSK